MYIFLRGVFFFNKSMEIELFLINILLSEKLLFNCLYFKLLLSKGLNYF